ncbi:MAG: hypothetical protein KJO95_08185 [Gammaproteobacteria bacterium]|nr:hypothetical protein [Gammaproteobacteria bacterium]
MGRTWIRQDAQIRRSVSYVDNVAAGATMESASVHLEDDLNNMRSQINRILKADSSLNWYDDVPTVTGLGASKKRGLTLLNTDLDELEEQRILCPVQVLTNVSVPAAVKASGSIVAIAKASITDGQTFTLDDGLQTAVVFEFDTIPDGVGGGNTLVDISGDTTAIEVASRMVTAINNVGANLKLTASNAGGTSATVTITHDEEGVVGNVTTWSTTTTMTVNQPTGGAGDVVVLSAAGSETPSDTAAIGTGLGAVVAVLSGDVGGWQLDNIAGSSSIAPKNMVWVRDHENHEGLTSDGKQVYGLLQAESGVVQGDTFNDTNKQVMISFYRINASDQLEHCPGIDIGGRTIEFVYSKRVTLDTLPEDCYFPEVRFTDGAASVSVTLNNAIDNQGTTPATQDTTIDIDMTTAGVTWFWRDALLADLFGVKEGSAGGTSEVQLTSDVDVFNVDAVLNDFAQGVKLDTGGTEIDIGVNAGVIETTGSNDLRVFGAGELYLDDGNQAGSSWAQTNGVKLSETQAEWNDYETEFGGEVSLLNAIVQAKNTGGLTRTVTRAVVSTNIAADADAGGPATANNLDTDLASRTGYTLLTDVDLYLNGVLLRPGADASANNDYYPGSTDVQWKFEFGLQASPGNPDVLTQILWGSV